MVTVPNEILFVNVSFIKRLFKLTIEVKMNRSVQLKYFTDGINRMKKKKTLFTDLIES